MSNQPSIPLLEKPHQFPATHKALQSPNGLLAASEEIDARWLRLSYSKGIFPWYSEGEPVLWWSPSPRAVLFTDSFRLRRSLRKAIKKNQALRTRKITLNHAFEQVMRNCAAPREDGLGTWITEEIIDSYTALHTQGLAHSVEHWENETLIGGLYCVSLGGMVFGESMFARATDASKIAFAYFVYWLRRQNVRMIDCQQATQHLISMGATTIDRTEFETELINALAQPALNWSPQILEWSHDAT